MNIFQRRWKFLLCAIFLFSVGSMFAEDQEQLRHDMLERVRQLRSQQSISSLHLKCGLSSVLDVLTNWGKFSEADRQLYQQLTAAPSRQKNRVIGHFLIHYDTTGVHTPSLLDSTGNLIPNTAEAYIDSVGTSFNMAWSTEIDILGYDPPQFESGQSYYNIYISELGTSVYGQTWPVSVISTSGPSRWDSYIEMDNDYFGFYTAGIPGLEVTSAHEFHHAIQLGSYGYWSTDAYFLELTSTWMEDVVHNDVNDYYAYLTNIPTQFDAYFNSLFAYPDARFTLANGSIEYGRAVWGKFIEKRFSRDVMLNTWRYIRQMPALSAHDHALMDVGSSFRKAFLEWAIWNMNTGVNADTVKYYEEGKHYPLMRFRPIVQYVSPQRSIEDTIQVLSSAYHPVLISGVPMTVIVSNINQSGSNTRQPFSYVMSDQGDAGAKHLTNGIYTKLNVNDPSNWSAQESVPSVVADVLVMPNPFLSPSTAPLNFRLPPLSQTTATLTIVNGSFDRIYSAEVPIVELHPSEPSIFWNGYDEGGHPASSGIYFYYIMIEDKQYIGKFALIRE